MQPHGSVPAGVPDGPVAEAERRRRVRRSALVFAVIAAAFYFGFIAMMVVRSAK